MNKKSIRCSHLILIKTGYGIQRLINQKCQWLSVEPSCMYLEPPRVQPEIHRTESVNYMYWNVLTLRKICIDFDRRLMSHLTPFMVTPGYIHIIAGGEPVYWVQTHRSWVVVEHCEVARACLLGTDPPVLDRCGTPWSSAIGANVFGATHFATRGSGMHENGPPIEIALLIVYCTRRYTTGKCMIIYSQGMCTPAVPHPTHRVGAW